MCVHIYIYRSAFRSVGVSCNEMFGTAMLFKYANDFDEAWSNCYTSYVEGLWMVFKVLVFVVMG